MPGFVKFHSKSWWQFVLEQFVLEQFVLEQFVLEQFVLEQFVLEQQFSRVRLGWHWHF